jgi:hypothetical protein
MKKLWIGLSLIIIGGIIAICQSIYIDWVLRIPHLDGLIRFWQVYCLYLVIVLSGYFLMIMGKDEK